MGTKEETSSAKVSKHIMLKPGEKFAFTFRQTGKGNNQQTFKGQKAGEDATAAAKAEAANGHTVWVLKPVELYEPLAVTPVKETKISLE